jgi:hypothetical protein
MDQMEDHAISPPTTSLLRQAIDYQFTAVSERTIAARSALRRTGAPTVSQLLVLNSGPLFHRARERL